jgi:Tfp pilus assembly protein PilV
MRDESGLSLIEAMIAIALLATALVATAQVLTTAASSNTVAGKATVAIGLASQKIEELRSSPARPAAGADRVHPFVRRWTIDVVPASVLGTCVIHVYVEVPGRHVTSLVAAARWP